MVSGKGSAYDRTGLSKDKGNEGRLRGSLGKELKGCEVRYEKVYNMQTVEVGYALEKTKSIVVEEVKAVGALKLVLERAYAV
jgi:hypothetical protein